MPLALCKLAIVAVLLAGCSGEAVSAGPQTAAVVIPPETPAAFAARVLALPVDDESLHVRPLTWNGRPLIFADHMQGENRDIVGLFRKPDASAERINVTTGEPEGGDATVVGIGAANADADPAQELIVILSWSVQHADVNGTLYEVRILDDAIKPGAASLTKLDTVSSKFEDNACDCSGADMPAQTFAFKTIPAVEAELVRLGF